MIRRAALACAAALLIGAPPAHADTVASLLGNFTVNQFAQLDVGARSIGVRYAVVLGQLPALRELHAADADGDGVTTAAERATYASRLAATLERGLVLTVDGARVPLRVVRSHASLPEEEGGFSLRIDVDLDGDLPEASGDPRSIALANDNYPGTFGWQEMVVAPAPGLAVFDTDAFSTSPTGGLTEALKDLPAAGPLAERAVRMRVTGGRVPDGAAPLRARDGTAAASTASAAPAATPADSASWLVDETRKLAATLDRRDLGAGSMLAALAIAMVLGALHAFAPGHGKTVVGAYLIGSRATARHAAFLGLTVTVTHTIGVFALGFATLAASAYVVPERVFPLLALASGLIVLGMGLVLLRERWPAARDALRRRASSFRTLRPAARGHVQASMAHAHEAAGWHSHGGTWHTHLPPGASGEAVTWRGLLALGISGGLVPCPSAMVLLLACIAMGRTALGLALVVAFSAGLAATLTAIGLAFLYARTRIPAGATAPRWTRVVPVMSAAAITVLGAVLCASALGGTQI